MNKCCYDCHRTQKIKRNPTINILKKYFNCNQYRENNAGILIDSHWWTRSHNLSKCSQNIFLILIPILCKFTKPSMSEVRNHFGRWLIHRASLTLEDRIDARSRMQRLLRCSVYLQAIYPFVRSIGQASSSVSIVTIILMPDNKIF